MHNARKILFGLAVTVLILACGFGGAAAPTGDEVATVVASTIEALSPVAPDATATTAAPMPPGIPVNYKNVSFTIPAGLAVDAAPQTVSAVSKDNGGPWWDAAPEHIEFRMDGYNVPAGSFSEIHVRVYPAQEYAAANDGANIGLQRLQGLLSSPSVVPTNSTLPQVPYFNAASMFAAQIKRIDFQSGHGLRMITQYGQAVGPIANNGTFYHFQGLTSDGKYYIIAVLPIRASFLQNGNDPSSPLPAGGIPFPGHNLSGPKYFDDYFKAITDKFDATAPDQFSPSLAALDALVQSLKVTP